MKKVLKKASLLTMLSLVVAFFAPCAYADYVYTSQSTVVYNPAVKSYYWDWDKDWSVPYLKLSNGWHVSASDTLYAFTVNSYRGKVGYCIAPGVIFTDQATYNTKKETYMDGVAAQNPVLSKDEVIELLGLVLSKAFKGDLKQSYFENESTGKDAFGHIWASQVLIWEVIVGERDADFNYRVASSGCSACKSAIKSVNPIYSKFKSHYSSMEKAVKKALKYPSFASAEDPDGCNVFELVWDGEKYSAVLSDDNAVLEGYQLASDCSDLRFTRNGNTVTVSSDVPLDEAYEVEMTATVGKDNITVWGSAGQNSFIDIKNNPYSYNQTLMFNAGSISVTKKAYFKVTTNEGEIKLTKRSAYCDITDDNANYSLAGAVYGVYTSGDTQQGTVDENSCIGSIVTDEDGNGSILTGISAGKTYYVKETSAPKGFCIDEKVYSVEPSGTGTEAAVVESLERPLNDPIAITLTKASSGESTMSLEGTEFTVRYYDLDPETEFTAEELEAAVPKRTWIIKVRKALVNGEKVYRTLLTPEYLADGSDPLYLSDEGETILPVGYFTVRETKAATGYTLDNAKYFSKGVLISENNETVVGKVDFEGNIYPEGINTVMFDVIDDPAPFDGTSPDTGETEIYIILMVVSLAVLIAYLDYEAQKEKR